MFLLAKFGLVTCAVYFGIVILIDGAIFAWSLWKGSFGLCAPKTAWIFFFGAVWLVSFLISWRIVVAPLFARIHTT